MKNRRTLATLATAALLMAACGGGDDSADTTGTSTPVTTAGDTAPVTTPGDTTEVPESVDVPIEGSVTFGAFDIEITGGVIESDDLGTGQTLAIDTKLTNGSDSPALPDLGEIVLELPDDESVAGSLDAEQVPSGRDGNGQLVFTLPSEDEAPFDETLLDEARIVMGSADVNQAIVSFADGVEASLEPISFDPVGEVVLDTPADTFDRTYGATFALETVEMRFTDVGTNSGLEAGSGLLALSGTWAGNGTQTCPFNLDESVVTDPDGSTTPVTAEADCVQEGVTADIELSADIAEVAPGEYSVVIAIANQGGEGTTDSEPIVVTLAEADLDGVLAPA